MGFEAALHPSPAATSGAVIANDPFPPVGSLITTTIDGLTIGRVDYLETLSLALRTEGQHPDPTDPALWLRAIFGGSGRSRLLQGLLGLRQLAFTVLRRPPTEKATVFRVRTTVDDRQAYIHTVEQHLTFRCLALVVDGNLKVSTAVEIHNRFGRLYFAPVRLVHPFVLRAMIRRARRSFRTN